jgi:gas vesicle protein
LPRRRDREAEMAEDRMSALYVTAGIVAGAALGVLAALALAPQSGAKTRKTIADMAERLKHQAERLAEQAGSRARDVIALQRDRFSRAVEAGREGTEEKREELHRRLREGE